MGGPSSSDLQVAALQAENQQLRAALEGSERERARLAVTQDRLRTLGQASAELARTLDHEATLRAVIELALPGLGDFGFFDVVEGDGVRRIARAYQDPRRQALLDGTCWVRSERTDINLCGLSTGRSELHAEIDDAWLCNAAAGPEHLSAMRELRFRSMITVPLVSPTRTLGALTLFMADSGRRFDALDLEIAEELARRAAAAVENARLYGDLEASERAAQAAYAAAREADRRKDQFLAMLGHELRNPLAPIQTALDLMHLRGPEAFLREREVIGRQVRHMVRLVDDLLDVSRITRGTIELDRAVIALAEVVADAVETATPLLEERHHELKLEVPGDLWVDADHHRLAQVIGNLLVNAARYTDPGGHLAIAASRDGDHIVLAVRDDGSGLDPAIIASIFEPFIQSPQPPDRGGGGLGLGLALVRSLVALHGGSIGAHSDGPGQGSEFLVRLPAARPRVEPPRPDTGTAKHAQGRRVLIVDDNRDLAETLAEAAEMLGHEVRIAYDGPQALAVARAFAPQIALLDLGLPVMTGHELARRLRALPQPPERLVAVSGYGTRDDRLAALSAGFDDHVAKPLDLPRLAELLDTTE